MCCVLELIVCLLQEEELRKEGGKKYGHLNDDLHVYMEITAPAEQAYEMMGRAIATVKPYFDPVSFGCLSYLL